MSYGGSSGGSSRISTAADAALSNPATNNLLSYNATTQKWVNTSLQALISALPTSASGLTAGALWINNGVLTVVAGSSSSAPSASLSGVSTALTVGSNVSGTLTLTNATSAYAVLYTGSAEQGSRSVTSGGALPTLTPSAAGTYTVRVYTASSGGTLLTESASFTVSAASSGGAGGATFSNVDTTVNATYSIGGSVTPAGSTPIYVVLAKSGVEQGTRITVASSASNLGILSPDTAGTYTARAYSAPTGGTLLAESASITVSAVTNLISPAYFVSPTGSDSNAGTAGAPFLTLGKARDMMRVAANNTKTTYIRGGTFALSAKFAISNYDTGTSWLAYPGETPVLDGGSTLADVFFMDAGTRSVTVNGLTIQNAYGCALHLNGYNSGGSDGGTITDVIISNCTFKNVVSNGSSAGNSGAIRGSFATRNNIIRNNLFQNCYGPGTAFVAGGTGEINIGNKIIRNTFIGMNNTGQSDSGSIYFLDRGHNALTTNPHIVNGNYVEDAGTATKIKHLYLDDNASCVIASSNIFCGTGTYGLQIHGGDNNTIVNNVFDITDISAFLSYYQSLGSSNTNYGMSNNAFTGNIVYCGGAYSQSNLWTTLDQTSAGIDYPSDTGNLYYRVGGTLPNTGVVIDSNPKVLNPNFTNAAGRNYALTSTANASQIGFAPINQAYIGLQ